VTGEYPIGHGQRDRPGDVKTKRRTCAAGGFSTQEQEKVESLGPGSGKRKGVQQGCVRREGTGEVRLHCRGGSPPDSQARRALEKCIGSSTAQIQMPPGGKEGWERA